MLTNEYHRRLVCALVHELRTKKCIDDDAVAFLELKYGTAPSKPSQQTVKMLNNKEMLNTYERKAKNTYEGKEAKPNRVNMVERFSQKHEESLVAAPGGSEVESHYKLDGQGGRVDDPS